MTKTKNWWANLYDEHLADFLLENRSEQEKERSTAFLIDKLELKPGNQILDQCCGTGTLSIHLAEKGYDLTAMDQAETYIEKGRQEAIAKGLSIDFEAADAFDYVCPKPCDAVFNWWTSFGYTMDDNYNQRMLQRAADSLKPGGRFILDTMNIGGVLRNFKEEVINEVNNIVLTRYTTIDWAEGVMLKKWAYRFPDGSEKVHESSVRLYFPHTIIEMLKDCGFENFELFGNEEGDELRDDSLRCIILARKKIC